MAGVNLADRDVVMIIMNVMFAIVSNPSQYRPPGTQHPDLPTSAEHSDCSLTDSSHPIK